MFVLLCLYSKIIYNKPNGETIWCTSGKVNLYVTIVIYALMSVASHSKSTYLFKCVFFRVA